MTLPSILYPNSDQCGLCMKALTGGLLADRTSLVQHCSMPPLLLQRSGSGQPAQVSSYVQDLCCLLGAVNRTAMLLCALHGNIINAMAACRTLRVQAKHVPLLSFRSCWLDVLQALC